LISQTVWFMKSMIVEKLAGGDGSGRIQR
jgi:hypothetical protein